MEPKLKPWENFKALVIFLDLEGIPIESLGNLENVGGNLNLYRSPIKSLGNLKSVGGYLDLRYTPMSRKYSENEIRDMINVGGNVYLK